MKMKQEQKYYFCHLFPFCITEIGSLGEISLKQIPARAGCHPLICQPADGDGVRVGKGHVKGKSRGQGSTQVSRPLPGAFRPHPGASQSHVQEGRWAPSLALGERGNRAGRTCSCRDAFKSLVARSSHLKRVTWPAGRDVVACSGDVLTVGSNLPTTSHQAMSHDSSIAPYLRSCSL